MGREKTENSYQRSKFKLCNFIIALKKKLPQHYLKVWGYYSGYNKAEVTSMLPICLGNKSRYPEQRI